MCGNGVRCVAKYVYDHGIARKQRSTIETGRGVLTLDLEIDGRQGSRVRVDMGAPIFQADPRSRRLLPGNPPVNVPIRSADTSFTDGRLDGQPPRGRLRRGRRRFPVETLGPLLERHPASPAGSTPLRRRCSPRRGEDADLGARLGITLACGTGAAQSASPA